MNTSDQNSAELLYFQDNKCLTLHWHSFECIVHSTSAAIDNCFLQDLSQFVVSVSNWDSAIWQSRAQNHSCSVHTDMPKNGVSHQMIYCAWYTSFYQLIFTSYCSPITHNISLTETLGQATKESWSTKDVLCATLCSLLCSSMFVLHWPSPTAFLPISVYFILAKPLWEHVTWHPHPAALSIPDAQLHCFVNYEIHRLPWNHLCGDLHNPTGNSSCANVRCPRCFHVWYARCLPLDNGWLSEFG